MGEQHRPRLDLELSRSSCRARTPGRDRRSARPTACAAITRSRPRCMVSIVRTIRATLPGPAVACTWENAADERTPPLRAGPPLGDAHLRRALRRPAIERALPPQPRQGPDGALGRLRPANPDRLRPRSHPRPRRGRQGRRLDRPQGRHARAARRHPARRDEHVDDDQRDRRLAARPLRHGRRRERRRSPRAQGHDPERHHQGVPVARDLRLPARPIDAADRRHRRLQRQRDPELEPDQRLQLPPPGGRGDAGAGDRLRDVAPRSPCSTRSRRAARSPRRTSRRCSGGSRSSSTPGCASSRSTRSCARWARCGSRSGASATGSPSRSSCGCVMAFRSTASA